MNTLPSRKPLYLFRIPVLIAAALLTGSCDKLMPLSAPPDEPSWTPYYCATQIFRAIPNTTEEFTQEWRLWAWPDDQYDFDDDGNISSAEAKYYCEDRLAEYMNGYLSPAFNWEFRPVTATLASSASPFLDKIGEEAVDCSNPLWDHIPPPTYGAPVGADILWTDPPREPPSPAGPYAWADVSILDESTGEVIDHASPEVKRVILRFAEHTGLPDQDGVYQSGVRHLRFSDIFLELEPFEFSKLEVSVKKFYIQSVGTVIAEPLAAGGVQYKSAPGNAKIYQFGAAEAYGGAGQDSTCFDNRPAATGAFSTVTIAQGPFANEPNLTYAASGKLLSKDGTQSMSIAIGLASPAGVPFVSHQPVVTSIDVAWPAPSVATLTANLFDHDSGSFDGKSDIDRVLWFEDFDTADEQFLGSGDPLTKAFGAGAHKVTAVVYDLKGAFNTLFVDLTGVPSVAPVANDDNYSVDEDGKLVVGSPGVLTNDTDANGDALTASKVTDPTHGALTLSSDGAFLYEPEPNYFGTDGFTYKASDGTLDSNVATVSITVKEVSTPDEIKPWIPWIDNLPELNSGQKNSLIVKLNQALKALASGNTKVACNALNAFMNEVESLMEQGILSPVSGQLLLDTFGSIRAELGCA